MITNKQNMLLETIAFLFLVTRDNISQTRRTTFECNGHYYGLWRMIQQEFNMKQLIRIFQKSIIKLQVIFESDLVTLRSATEISGYQHTFPDLINRPPMESALDKLLSEDISGI